MSTQPDWKKWTDNLLLELQQAPPEQRENILMWNLLQAEKRGYREGLENGWANEQDKELRKLDQKYEEAQKKMAKGEAVAGLYHCDCYRINKQNKNYNASCWRCDSNY